MRSLPAVCVLCLLGTIAFADETPSGISWSGRVSVGSELDERGVPTDEKLPQEKTAENRLGFSASWSFTLHWDRIEPPQDGGGFEAAELTADEAKLIELTNAERKKRQLPPLQPDPVLMKLARTHSVNMANLDQIGHEFNGKTFSQRMQQVNYQASRAGENVAQGQRTPGEAIAGWMQSPGHKGNILQADYTRIGVGMASSKSGKPYFTQVFAKPFGQQK